MVSLVAYCADRLWLETNDRDRDSISPNDIIKTKLEALKKEDPGTWGGSFSKTKFTPQFNAMLAAVLPAGYTLPFDIRNADRRYFMDRIHATGKGTYDLKDTGYIYETLFETLRYAQSKHHYTVKSNVSGIIVTTVDKDGKTVQKLSASDKKRVKAENKAAREAAKEAKAAAKEAEKASADTPTTVADEAPAAEEKAA